MIDKILKRHSVVGVIGNRSTGKSLAVLHELKQLRKKYPKLNISVMGAEPETQKVLRTLNIQTIINKVDILDLKMKDTVIFIDEFALFFDTKSRNKQQDKLLRFFDRIEHNNCKIIIGTAREGYFNKFMCARVTAFLVKQVEYDALVNGTWIKDKVKSITSLSDYRLQCPINQMYIVTNKEELTEIVLCPYDKELDSKKQNIDLFQNKK